MVERLLSDGRIGLEDCTSRKTGRHFDAAFLLSADPDGRACFQLEFDSPKNRDNGGKENRKQRSVTGTASGNKYRSEDRRNIRMIAFSRKMAPENPDSTGSRRSSSPFVTPTARSAGKGSGNRRCRKTTGNGFPEIPGMLPERKHNLWMTRNETGGRAAGTQTGGPVMDSNRKSDERTVRSAAEQIRGQLEQFQEGEFIMQIPLNAAPEREVKNHE